MGGASLKTCIVLATSLAMIEVTLARSTTDEERRAWSYAGVRTPDEIFAEREKLLESVNIVEKLDNLENRLDKVKDVLQVAEGERSDFIAWNAELLKEDVEDLEDEINDVIDKEEEEKDTDDDVADIEAETKDLADDVDTFIDDVQDGVLVAQVPEVMQSDMAVLEYDLEEVSLAARELRKAKRMRKRKEKRRKRRKGRKDRKAKKGRHRKRKQRISKKARKTQSRGLDFRELMFSDSSDPKTGDRGFEPLQRQTIPPLDVIPLPTRAPFDDGEDEEDDEDNDGSLLRRTIPPLDIFRVNTGDDESGDPTSGVSDGRRNIPNPNMNLNTQIDPLDEDDYLSRFEHGSPNLEDRRRNPNLQIDPVVLPPQGPNVEAGGIDPKLQIDPIVDPIWKPQPNDPDRRTNPDFELDPLYGIDVPNRRRPFDIDEEDRKTIPNIVIDEPRSINDILETRRQVDENSNNRLEPINSDNDAIRTGFDIRPDFFVPRPVGSGSNMVDDPFFDHDYFNTTPVSTYLRDCNDCMVRSDEYSCPLDSPAQEMKRWAGQLQEILSFGCNRPEMCDNPGRCCLDDRAEFRNLLVRITEMLKDLQELLAAECTGCSVDCGWSEWSEWSACDVTCGSGSRQRTRSKDNPARKGKGKPCVGVAMETERCVAETECCEPVDGGWSTWTSWSPCSQSCGEGRMERTRVCNNPPANMCGVQCQGTHIETKTCNILPCLAECFDGNWGAWGTWSACSISCGSGTRERFRSCDDPAPNYCGLQCLGYRSDAESCQEAPCPILSCAEPMWSSWGSWSPCQGTCGFESVYRYRSCDAPNDVPRCGPCEGSDREVTERQCGPLEEQGEWSTWSQWSQCSASCGRGVESRTRKCEGILEPCTIPCDGLDFEERSCDMGECLEESECAEPMWTSWGRWSPCQGTCGFESIYRYRSCEAQNGVPRCGPCEGDDMEVTEKQCGPLEEQGEWSTWSRWSQCSASCGRGVESRTRKCEGILEPCTIPCDGLDFEERGCDMGECLEESECVTSWTLWGTWSECSATCGFATRRRFRSCEVLTPGLGCDVTELSCEGSPLEAETCDLEECTTWSSWTPCSATCQGLGRRERKKFKPGPYGMMVDDVVVVAKEMETCQVTSPSCPGDNNLIAGSSINGGTGLPVGPDIVIDPMDPDEMKPNPVFPNPEEPNVVLPNPKEFEPEETSSQEQPKTTWTSEPEEPNTDLPTEPMGPNTELLTGPEEPNTDLSTDSREPGIELSTYPEEPDLVEPTEVLKPNPTEMAQTTERPNQPTESQPTNSPEGPVDVDQPEEPMDKTGIDVEDPEDGTWGVGLNPDAPSEITQPKRDRAAQWSPWGTWCPCDCSTGLQNRVRRCVYPGTGVQIPLHKCPGGPARENRTCDVTTSCPHCTMSCENLSDGKYPACTGCDHYLHCQNGKARLYRCRQGQTEWDAFTATCNRPPSPSCLLKEPVLDCRSFADGLYHSGRGCDKYVECAGGTLIELECAPGFEWNQNNQLCEPMKSLTCVRPISELDIINQSEEEADNVVDNRAIVGGLMREANDAPVQDYFNEGFGLSPDEARKRYDERMKREKKEKRRREKKRKQKMLERSKAREASERATSSLSSKPRIPKCVTSCEGLNLGAYPSCRSCYRYVICTKHGRFREGPCRRGRQFDVRKGKCRRMAKSCASLP